MSNPTNPPALPVMKPPTHATYIPERSPKWKYHQNIGQAKNACSYTRRESWMYEVDAGGQLVELYHIDPKQMPTQRAINGLTYHHWGPEFMPWNNTREAKAKQRQEKIDELTRRLENKEREVKQLREELFRTLGKD